MDIMLVGVFDDPYSSNISMANALENIGHRVTRFSYREIAASAFNSKNRFYRSLQYRLNRKLRNISRNRVFDFLYYRLCGKSELTQQLIKKSFEKKYDLILFIKADILNPSALKTITQSYPTWYYFMDWIKTANQINAQRYAQLSSYASANYSDVYQSFLQKNPKSIYLTQGADTSIFYSTSKNKSIDVTFVGNPLDQRLKLIGFLRKCGIKVQIFGPETKNGSVYGKELAEIYRKSKIVLNLSRCPHGFSIRVFQAMASGSLVLSQYCSDLELVFKREAHLDWFETPEECVDKIRYYLKNPKIRKSITENGCQFVTQNYSWEKVLQRLIDHVKKH